MSMSSLSTLPPSPVLEAHVPFLRLSAPDVSYLQFLNKEIHQPSQNGFWTDRIMVYIRTIGDLDGQGLADEAHMVIKILGQTDFFKDLSFYTSHIPLITTRHLSTDSNDKIERNLQVSLLEKHGEDISTRFVENSRKGNILQLLMLWGELQTKLLRR